MNHTKIEAQLSEVKEWGADRVGELVALSRFIRLWKFAPGSQFAPGVLRALAQLRKLEFLYFDGGDLERNNLLAFADIPLLRRLHLQNCRFDADDLTALCSKFAAGSAPKLQDLWLENTPTTDEDLKAVGKIERLRWLILSGTQVTDAGLEHLHSLKKLEVLWLHGTKVSDAGVLRLVVLPRLTALVTAGTSCSPNIYDQLFEARLAKSKSKKPVNTAQVESADKVLRAFIGQMENWERDANTHASDIRERHKSTRPHPNTGSDAEAKEDAEFWRDLSAQKADIVGRFCSQKLLTRGVGFAGGYGNPPRFETKLAVWFDVETPSKTKTVFYGSGRTSQRRYTMILDGSEWKLDEVQRWSGNWIRDFY